MPWRPPIANRSAPGSNRKNHTESVVYQRSYQRCVQGQHEERGTGINRLTDEANGEAALAPVIETSSYKPGRQPYRQSTAGAPANLSVSQGCVTKGHDADCPPSKGIIGKCYGQRCGRFIQIGVGLIFRRLRGREHVAPSRITAEQGPL